MSKTKVIKKSFSGYKVSKDMKYSYTPSERGEGIKVLTELGFNTYPNFMGGVKNV